jgi:hypothetical protein
LNARENLLKQDLVAIAFVKMNIGPITDKLPQAFNPLGGDVD